MPKRARDNVGGMVLHQQDALCHILANHCLKKMQEFLTFPEKILMRRIGKH